VARGVEEDLSELARRKVPELLHDDRAPEDVFERLV
jgi:hypothetical protein